MAQCVESRQFFPIFCIRCTPLICMYVFLFISPPSKYLVDLHTNSIFYTFSVSSILLKIRKQVLKYGTWGDKISRIFHRYFDISNITNHIQDVFSCRIVNISDITLEYGEKLFNIWYCTKSSFPYYTSKSTLF